MMYHLMERGEERRGEVSVAVLCIKRPQSLHTCMHAHPPTTDDVICSQVVDDDGVGVVPLMGL